MPRLKMADFLIGDWLAALIKCRTSSAFLVVTVVNIETIMKRKETIRPLLLVVCCLLGRKKANY